jgi:hypothetical protein
MNKRGRAGAAAIVTVAAACAALVASGPAARAGGESFRTVETARFAEVIRGVSFTPGPR